MSQGVRVGILTEGTIGDSLILVPTLRMLEQHFADSAIELISFTNSRSTSAGAFLNQTFANFTFSVVENSVDKHAFGRLGAWLDVVRLIRQKRLSHLVYAFRPESQQASKRARWHRFIISTLTSVATIGFNVDRWPGSDENSDRSKNLIARILFDRLAADLNLNKAFEAYDHRIEVASADKVAGQAWIQKHISVSDAAYYVVCVSGKEPVQRWPQQRYIEVMSAVHRQYGLLPVLLGAPSETTAHQRIIDELGFGGSCSGLTVGQSCEVIRSAAFYLGNDTGPMHLAAALGVPCIVVQSARWLPGSWDPLGEGHIVHQYAPACAACGLADCKLTEQLCMTGITPQQVLASCEKVITQYKSLSQNESDVILSD